jgi:hypothetical protein
LRTAGVALTSERSGRSAVAVAEADGCGDEDDVEDAAADDAARGWGGTDSEVARGIADCDGADAGDADEGG